MDETGLRDQLLATARAMNGLGLNQGAAGNVSVRCRDGLLITPSALAYNRCTAADLVWLGQTGQTEGSRKPSSEWRMHRDIYGRFPDAKAVLHVHAVHSTALACLGRPIPAFHYMVAVAGGDSIRCAPYAPFGSQALSDLAIEALADRRAALLGHHGMICHAVDLEQVLALAVEVETLARMYLLALQVAEPPLLSAAEMADVLMRFKAYRP